MSIRVLDFFPAVVSMTPDISFQIISNKKFSQVSRDQREFYCFDITGSLQGSFVAYSEEDLEDQTKGVLIEALNIVIGKVIGSIEDESGILLDLSAPVIDATAPYDISAKNEVCYQLKIKDKEVNCFLFNDLQQLIDLKERTSPVLHGKEGVTHA